MSERGYVVGDLHLGAGAGDPLEDFRDDDRFAAFCERIASPEATLFLNGDIVDFAQIEPFEVPKPAHLLWPEPASVRKLETAIGAHRDFFAALKNLIARGARVRMLVGNHDLDMVWPQVRARLATELGDPGDDRLGFVVGACVFHGVHLEHGHHFTPENCPRDPERFVHEAGGTRYLERVWGTDFMLRFYNDLERRYPFADNVKPMLAMVWHGIRNRWIGGRELMRLLVFLKRRGIPWGAIAGAVLADDKPLAAAGVAASFDDPEWRAAVLDRVRTDPSFVAELQTEFADLEPVERQIAASPDKIEAVPPAIAPADLAAPTLGLFRDDREIRAARERLGKPGITHVVFGHTHTVVDGELDGRLFNYGTWLPALDLADAHIKAKVRAGGVTLDMLSDVRLYRADRRVVRIDADKYEAKVRLVTDDEP